MTSKNIQEMLEAAKKAKESSSGDANTTEKIEENKETSQVGANDPALAALENLALRRTEVQHTPIPEIVGADIVHQAPVVDKGPKNPGYYAKTAGAINGARRLVKLIPTLHGGYQSFEDAEATGSIKNWEYLIKKGVAEKVEDEQPE